MIEIKGKRKIISSVNNILLGLIQKRNRVNGQIGLLKIDQYLALNPIHCYPMNFCYNDS